jgi:hypothetical protein
MITMVVGTLVIGGAMAFVVNQANLTVDATDRADLQTDGRRALRTITNLIGEAGTGLPNYLAFRSFNTTSGTTSADSCKSPATPELTFTSVDYSRMWTVASASGDSDNEGTISLATATPNGGDDVAIPAQSWVYVYRAPFHSPTAATAVGHGLLQVRTNRNVGDTTVTFAASTYSDQQGGNFEPDDSSGDAMYMFVADVTTIGVNCADLERPYIYMRTGADLIPILDNVDLNPIPEDDNSIPATEGDILALRFRLWVDDDGDTRTNLGTVWKESVTAPDTNEMLSRVVRVEFAFRLRSKNPTKPNGTEYRQRNYVRRVDIPNLDPNMQSYIFVQNGAL